MVVKKVSRQLGVAKKKRSQVVTDSSLYSLKLIMWWCGDAMVMVVDSGCSHGGGRYGCGGGYGY